MKPRPKIYRPRKFMAAPLRLGPIAGIAMLVFVLLAMEFLNVTTLLTFIIIPTHVACIWIGIQEPHVDSISTARGRVPKLTGVSGMYLRRFPRARGVRAP